jgi:kynureninase
MAEFAGVWGKPDDQQWPYALGKRQDFINRWRAILNAPDGTLTTTESVTASLSALIGALPSDLLRGRKILVAGDCFPSVHFLLTGLQDTARVSACRPSPCAKGASWAEDEDITVGMGAGRGSGAADVDLLDLVSPQRHRKACRPRSHAWGRSSV